VFWSYKLEPARGGATTKSNRPSPPRDARSSPGKLNFVLVATPRGIQQAAVLNENALIVSPTARS